ncbi:aminotransferase class I/II-fold pyridoxal phosphate-dependent enzyme [Domibacillus sp. A3M-37]|uniref:aminotransferase class I/II-fold pyridoxal phosphate-dependent enzyme n=1 Tax=Domibacillus sp. A3M-37 TaxID=2962037 RepID=UPI0020B8B1AF|nr:aminotransferase class I/II-fold pyridoxal phosphate-dependent enzyme [Domibacillus sp. A3M-37]MCP3762818.1 aminotransferase class I/II-fold pyridoxal phosphate-dependent enzyme [Domibacillus sp. A3M-37]
MTIEPSIKMAAFDSSIFSNLKTYTDEKKQKGKTLIDLSLGSPDLPPDERIRAILANESAKSEAYGYTLGGTELFYKSVADYYKRRSGINLNPKTEIVQTMGSQEGLVHLPLAFCNPGDIVLTTNPAYVAYEAGITLAGAVQYYMPLLSENRFLPDLSLIPDDVAKKAKLMLLNLPGNPVPAMPDDAFFEQVIVFAKKHQIIVLHDAAYSEFYFTGEKPFSFLAIPGAMEVGIEINSLSKSFSLAGARVAYIAGNAGMIAVLKQLKSNLDYGVFDPIQKAAAFALDQAEEITDKLRAEFRARAEALSTGLQNIGWPVERPNGGMFLWAKIPRGEDDRAFVFQAIDESGVVMVPGSAFGTAGKDYVRIALVQPVPILKQAAKELKKVIS